MTVRRRRTISATKRAATFERHGGVCHICEGKIDAGQRWEVSHPTPLELGGADDESNWQPAHYKCHRDLTAKVDVPIIRKAQRRERKHIGAKPRKWNWPKRPFPQRRGD
jgi:5-methylcytosine-specific restriction protein A